MTQLQDQQHLHFNQQGYRDATALLPMQSKDPCYRMGYDRGLRDASPIPEDASDNEIVFEQIDNSGKWQATVDGVEIRIGKVIGGYKTNLTGNTVLIDFGIAIKESLLAVARLASSLEETRHAA
jgi:hypothetical protein